MAGMAWVGTTNSYKGYGEYCGIEFVELLQLLDVALVTRLFFWLRNKLLVARAANAAFGFVRLGFDEFSMTTVG